MKEADGLPIALNRLSVEACVAEVVVNPPMTPLLRAAASRGCAIVTGDAMLQPQPRLMATFLGLGPVDPMQNG